ncbi:hypothetical protein B0H17DRAFT_1102331 [Mycena rosella]|uniref:Uncharacterized protein n=1 Tax=Mycena rosella TaxID=1033263 RepID=A0AAD7CJP6_MYCRO|nr:hypothetical protein B0H17DRAFT_1102331 [Mycena rosella]
MPSMSDLLSMPLDSSPLKPDSPTSSPKSSGTSLPADPSSPSPAQRAPRANQRKRPTEDMTQFAGEVSRANKLVKVDHDQLQIFAKSDRAEQLILLAGSLLSLVHQQRLLHPADSPIVVPKKLRNKILEHASILLLDASIPAYVDKKIGPTKLLMDLVILNGSAWGFSTEMAADSDQVKAVTLEITNTLTTKRHAMKSIIGGSLGGDPVLGGTLRSDALNVLDLANSLVQKVTKVKLDLPLCGRIGFLRKTISEGNDNRYWITIDIELAEMRGTYPDAKKMSRFIKQYILDPDMKRYGTVDLATIGGASGRRQTANAAASTSMIPPAAGGGTAVDR